MPAPSPTLLAGGGTWTVTGSMSTSRGGHTATLLADGRVLVAGGQVERHAAAVASAEIYDPQTGMWTVTGSMSMSRWAHTATLLPSGKVLVAGGLTSFGDYLASAELFDPASGTWQATGSMLDGHAAHTATLLHDGKVLVAGGSPGPSELYDPTVGAWTATGALPLILDSATATLLDDGDVVVAGGVGYDPDRILQSTEIYDVESATWSQAADLPSRLEFHATALLVDGKVLVTGGYDPDRGALDSADLWDPSGDEGWGRTGSMHEARLGHTATTLADGLVLVAGGQAGPSKESLSSAELYDSSMQGWRQANPMATARDGHTATLLDDGELLVAGGFVAGGTTASAEVYGPDPRQLPAEGRADNGRYATTFDPPLSFTLTLRASVGVNAPAFIGLAFGFDPLVAHGGGTWAAEIQFNRPDQVFDVDRPDVLVDTPQDLGAWIANHPDVTVVSGPVKTTIGGRDATRIDIVAGADGVTFGPIQGFPDIPLGMGPGQHQRLFIVMVGEKQVLIRINLFTAGNDNGQSRAIDEDNAEHFDRALKALQPMLDSVVWQ